MKKFLWALLASCVSGMAQQSDFDLNAGRPILDAHNCYPYDGRWANRIDRALKLGFPIGIEQDLAWSIDAATGKGKVVVAHSAETTGLEPTLRDYFFERVRPIVERALKENKRSEWPLIVVHFDVKDNREELLHAVWELLGHYEGWITTAEKTADSAHLSPFDVKPLLVLTEDPDIQQRIFFDELAPGAKLRLFGSAHTAPIQAASDAEKDHLLATLPPEKLLQQPASNYRRWWNSSWHAVEEGGQPRAGAWTAADGARLRSLVERAHALGYWMRFYTLDGFAPSRGDQNGWFKQYNFGSLEAAEKRWQAAADAGVNLIASDQYEDLREFLRRISPRAKQ